MFNSSIENGPQDRGRGEISTLSPGCATLSHVSVHFRISERAGRIAPNLCGAGDTVTTHFAQSSGRLHVHVRTDIPYLRNGWTACIEVWLLARRPLAICFIPSRVGYICSFVSTHLYRISEAAWCNVLKFGAWLLTKLAYRLYMPTGRIVIKCGRYAVTINLASSM